MPFSQWSFTSGSQLKHSTSSLKIIRYNFCLHNLQLNSGDQDQGEQTPIHLNDLHIAL